MAVHNDGWNLTDGLLYGCDTKQFDNFQDGKQSCKIGLQLNG